MKMYNIVLLIIIKRLDWVTLGHFFDKLLEISLNLF